jgi:DNA polymerase-3 subunit beta
MEIKTEHLKAALLAAGKKDIRYYLNGVHVNAKHIVATDGYRMNIIAHGGEWPHEPVTIPREAVEMAVKLKLKTVDVTPEAIGPIAFKPLDGKFPDYLRVMPSLSLGVDQGGVHTQVNPDFLRDAVAAVRLVVGHAHVSLSLVGGTYVWSNAQIQVIVMPLRDATKDGSPKMVSLQPLAS